MHPIQATTRTISATFSLEDSLDLYSLGCSYDLESEMLNILATEIFLETPDEFKPIQIEIETYE